MNPNFKPFPSVQMNDGSLLYGRCKSIQCFRNTTKWSITRSRSRARCVLPKTGLIFFTLWFPPTKRVEGTKVRFALDEHLLPVKKYAQPTCGRENYTLSELKFTFRDSDLDTPKWSDEIARCDRWNFSPTIDWRHFFSCFFMTEAFFEG